MKNKKSYLLLVLVLIFGGLVVGLSLLTNPVWAAESATGGKGLSTWTASGYNSLDVQPLSQLDESSFSVTGAKATQSQVGCVVNTTGAISHWSLDEVSGSTFVDSISSFNGTCTGGTCPSATFGILSNAQAFTASQKDVISVPANVDPADTAYDNMANGNFSVGLWVKTNQDCTNNKVFIGRYRTTPVNGNWWLGCTSPGVAVFRLRDSDNNIRQVNGGIRINDGLWHYVVGVRDKINDKNYLYVDGRLDGMLNSPAFSGNFSSDDPITMGAYDEPRDYYLQGKLDEIVTYNRVLTGSEISSQFTDCSPTRFTYLPIVTR